MAVGQSHDLGLWTAIDLQRPPGGANLDLNPEPRQGKLLRTHEYP